MRFLPVPVPVPVPLLVFPKPDAGMLSGMRSVREVLKALIAPLEIGGALLGWQLERMSTELGMRLTFRGPAGEGPIHVEVGPLREGARYAAKTERLGISYRRCPAFDRQAGALCAALAPRIAQQEAALERLQDASAEARIRDVEVTQLLEPMGEGRFYGLSPYVGCLVGCKFCYAQSRLMDLRTLLGLADVPWGSWVDVRVNAAEVLRAELHTLPPLPIKFCPIVSDPYHPLEAKRRITRACLEVLLEVAPSAPVLVLTRTALARRDFDLLASLNLRLGVSLPTLDDETRQHFEPRGAPIPERLALLADARAAGIATFAVVQPMLEGPREALADALAAHVDSVSLDVLHGEQGAASDFDDPRYAHTREAGWQQNAAGELDALLEARGVPRWAGELPPDLR